MQINATTAATQADPTSGRTTTVPMAADATVTPAASSQPARLLNPQPTIDPALGIVVTEYFNHAGEMTNQYPTARALDSYRIHGLPGSNASTGGSSGS